MFNRIALFLIGYIKCSWKFNNFRIVKLSQVWPIAINRNIFVPSALVFKRMSHFSFGTIVALAPAAMSMKINTKTHVGIKEAKRRHKLLEVK